MSDHQTKQPGPLKPYINTGQAWAFSLGATVGWGSLFITGTTCLPAAGPLGSAAGMLIGAFIILMIAGNYHFLMNCYPDCGGVYTYTKEVFGYDCAFVSAWFLMLTCFSVLCANAASLPLYAGYLFGDLFKFGFSYSIFGCQVYLGEALLSICALLLTGWLCARYQHLAVRLNLILAAVFTAGIIICTAAALLKRSGSAFSVEPLFIPEKNTFRQVAGIAFISPWAFIGFENISHMTEELSCPRKKAFRVLTLSVVTSTVLYILLTFLSVLAYPPEYDSWLAYIRDVGNLEGVKGLPAFYAAEHFLGSAGTGLLLAVLFSLIMTSLICNILALSRLFSAMARDDVLPVRFSRQGKDRNPAGAVMLIVFLSALIPFLGRMAIGWIVDVTAIGAALVYAFVSAAALKKAREDGSAAEITTGLLGLLLMILFEILLLFPGLVSAGTMAPVSCILFIIWSFLGFLFFNVILRREKTDRFGHSVIVWVILLFMILFTSVAWMTQESRIHTEKAIYTVRDHIHEIQGRSGNPAEQEDMYIRSVIRSLNDENSRSTAVFFGLFFLSLGVMANNYFLMKKRHQKMDEDLTSAKSKVYMDPLTGVKSRNAFLENMSRLSARQEAGELDRLAIVVCDINNLKVINDTYGHEAGDRYIFRTSRLICTVFKHSPVYRTGGDEFAVILGEEDYLRRYEIMQEMNEEAENEAGMYGNAISAGLAEYTPGMDRSVQDVFNRADALMYERKKVLKQGFR